MDGGNRRARGNGGAVLGRGGAAVTDFPNAPTWYARSDTATVTPATRIGMAKGGKWIAVDVLMQYGRPVPLTLALRRVSIGRTVFVAREDAGTVLDAVNGLGVANGETA